MSNLGIPFRITLGGTGLALLLLAACGDSYGPNGGGDTATLSGTVRAAGAALADATVSIGTLQATSDANGQFKLTGVRVGAATVRAERPGYQPAQAAVTIAAGDNRQDFALTPQEIYTAGANSVYVPPGVEPIRGAIIVLGGPVTAGFVTGERLTPSTSPPELEPSLQAMGASLRALARSERVALLGSRTIAMGNNASSDNALFAALSSTAQLSGHPELADAPVLAFGLSAGCPEAAGLVARNADRAIGLLVRVPTSVTALTAPSALAVPAFVMQAEADAVVNNSAVRMTFQSNRSRGGRWALAVEPGVGHSVATSLANGTVTSWIRSALAARLPATPGGPLVALDESSGWLGSQATLEIAPWADYAGARSGASWLISESAAVSWRALGTPAAPTTDQLTAAPRHSALPRRPT